MQTVYSNRKKSVFHTKSYLSNNLKYSGLVEEPLNQIEFAHKAHFIIPSEAH